jgi:glucose/arabinose dehydrogenase
LLNPDFKTNNEIYLAYAAQKDGATTTKIIRAVLRDNALTEIKTILAAEPYTENERYHYGGGMIFGGDGKLYITIGERLFSEENQPKAPIAQDITDRRGKIYRFNPDGSIPADNPDFGPEASAGIYALGIRAAQGLALHPVTKEIWFSEHGTHQGDEINRLIKGANYGWPIKTSGKYRFADYAPPAMDGTKFTDPEWFWLQTVAPTGLTFYRGDEFPTWNNDLRVPGLSRGSLWRINFEDSKIASIEELFIGDHVRSRKAAQSPNGTLYMLTDTEYTIVPGVRAINNGAPSGQLIRIRNAANE